MTFILSRFLGIIGSLKVFTRRLSSKCTPVVIAIFVHVLMFGIAPLLFSLDGEIPVTNG
jgi:hypothetical protein